MKNKILYIGGFELPDKNAAAHRVIANAKILDKLGYEVIFISFDKSNEKFKNIKDSLAQFDNFTYYRLKYPRTISEWFTYLTSINHILELLDKSYYAIFAYNYPAIALNKLIKYSHKKNIKVFADSTEWYKSNDKNIFYRILKEFDTNYRMKRIHLKTNGLIAISSAMHNYYSNKMNNIILIPPLVDKKSSKWDSNIDSKELDSHIILTYSGSPGQGSKDRIDLLVDSVMELSNKYPLKLRIVGISEAEYINNFNVINVLNYSNIVEFTGRVSHLKSIEYIKNSHFLFFLRDSNIVTTFGFPTKFVESLACGTPILTNLSSDIDKYLINGFNGYIIDYSNKKTLISNLEKILNNKDKFNLMKYNCIRYEVFDINKYENLFQNFIN